MRDSSMEPTKNDKTLDANSKINENSSSAVEVLLNELRKTGITGILTMNKKEQITVSNWAHEFVNQYDAILKNNPMKLKDISELPCSKMDAKMAIKLLLLASVEKGLKDNTVVKLKDKFVRLGTFQSIDQEDISKLTKHLSYIQNKPMDADTSSFPELNKYMDLILSEQKALLEEINSFIEDILKIKKVR
jgi:NurA-like 5'-3' nuclease